MSLNPGRVELGVRSTSVLSRTWTKYKYMEAPFCSSNMEGVCSTMYLSLLCYALYHFGDPVCTFVLSNFNKVKWRPYLVTNISILSHFLGSELRQKIESEHSEIERLNQDIADVKAIRQNLYSSDDDDDDDDSDDGSDDGSSDESLEEEMLLEMLQQLTRENKEIEVRKQQWWW